MKQAVQVSIMNQTFSVETDATEKHVGRVAKLVNKKVEEIQKQTRSASSLHVALLACLNLADEFLRFYDDADQRSKEAEQKINDLLEIVDLHI